MHWMRLNEQPTLAASARASIVLATPGTSSSRMCPSQNQETSDSTICGRLPTITFSTLAMIFLAVVATSAMPSRLFRWVLLRMDTCMLTRGERAMKSPPAGRG